MWASSRAKPRSTQSALALEDQAGDRVIGDRVVDGGSGDSGDDGTPPSIGKERRLSKVPFRALFSLVERRESWSSHRRTHVRV